MKNNKKDYLTAKSLSIPALEKLSLLAFKLANVAFIVVYPKHGGWQQTLPLGRVAQPEFCKLIQQTKDGYRQCRMCHILMSVAAGTQGMTEQCCHAKVSVLAIPVDTRRHDTLALLSTCVFTNKEPQAWQEVEDIGARLDIDRDQLMQAYKDLPTMNEQQIEMIKLIMETGAEVIKNIETQQVMASELELIYGSTSSKPQVQDVIRNELHSAARIKPLTKKNKSNKKRNTKANKKQASPLLIDVISQLVSEKPNLPFTVTEISTAARITPNHLSTMFRRYTGQSFMQFLTDKRMELAKNLLQDLTLNIGEVARMSGYDDPAYFSRLFRQKVGSTPRNWRASLSIYPDSP